MNPIITVKKKDFFETFYTDYADCVLTRALRRAGMFEHRHLGGNDVSHVVVMPEGGYTINSIDYLLPNGINYCHVYTSGKT